MLLCSNELFLAYIEARPGLIPILVTEDRQTARVIRQNENPARFPRRGLGSPHGVGDTKGYVTGAPFRKLTGAPKVPHGTSGADSPRAYFPGKPAAFLHHAQAAAVLDHSRTLPQGDGSTRPALAGGEEGGERGVSITKGYSPVSLS